MSSEPDAPSSAQPDDSEPAGTSGSDEHSQSADSPSPSASPQGPRPKPCPRSSKRKKQKKRKRTSPGEKSGDPEHAAARAPGSGAARRAYRELQAWLRRTLGQEFGDTPFPPDLTLSVRLDLQPGDRSRRGEHAFVRDLEREIQRAKEEHLIEELGYRPGHLHCHWCGTSICEHPLPPPPRSIFRVYDPTGTPRWRDFGSWVVERGDPRLDRLYLEEPQPLAIAVEAKFLTEDLLQEFERSPEGAPPYHVVAQVVAGCFRLPTPKGGEIDRGIALTGQVIERRGAGGEPAYSWNVLCEPPHPHHLPTLVSERLHPILSPWLRGMAAEIRDLERKIKGARREGRRASIESNRTQARQLIEHAVKQLEKYIRQGERRTRHARKRTRDPQRPTASALSDALRAPDDHLFLDRSQQTIIVRGPRNRVHVFNADGTLVTSIVYGGKAIADRVAQGRWVPLEGSAIEALRAALTLRSDGNDEESGVGDPS
ncbi:MAG: hypothetical protein AAF488_09545 [Planctomycetota bacterium]